MQKMTGILSAFYDCPEATHLKKKINNFLTQVRSSAG
jgi:hypothetical protein